MMNQFKKLLFAFFTIFLIAQVGIAQRGGGDVGIGAQFGEPTGLTVKFYNPGTSLEILASWDLDDYFFADIHATFDHHLNNSGSIHLFYGPGGFIEIEDQGSKNDFQLGLSGRIGVDFILGFLELFIHATPRIELLESTDFDVGGGIGFRVYF